MSRVDELRTAVLREARSLSQRCIGLAHEQGLADDRAQAHDLGKQLSECNLRMLYLIDVAEAPSSSFPVVPYIDWVEVGP